MTVRRLFQLQLKTEELGRGSRLQSVGIIRFSSLRIRGWREEKLTPKRPTEREKETGPPFPMAAGSQRGGTSRQKLTYEARLRDSSRAKLRMVCPSGEALQKILKIFLASWSLPEIIRVLSSHGVH
jgi:hypothetical protein